MMRCYLVHVYLHIKFLRLILQDHFTKLMIKCISSEIINMMGIKIIIKSEDLHHV